MIVRNVVYVFSVCAAIAVAQSQPVPAASPSSKQAAKPAQADAESRRATPVPPADSEPAPVVSSREVIEVLAPEVMAVVEDARRAAGEARDRLRAVEVRVPAPPAPPIPAGMDWSDFEHKMSDLEHRFEFDFKLDHFIDPKFEMKLREAESKVRDLEFRFEKDFAAGRDDMERAFHLAQVQPPQPPQPGPAPNPWPKIATIGRGNRSEENLYRSGMRALDSREWNEALENFDAAAAKKGTKADGALHWKAYALHKLGRRDDALATVAELKKTYPSSRWLDDAKALEMEVKQASGQPLSPEQQTDEDLKLMAINALIGSDPERAVPLLEKLLARTSSPRLKERALFVLAQSRSPQAQAIVVNFARGKGNPDLQHKAVEYLTSRGKESLPVLDEIYAASTDANIRRRVVQGYMVARDADRLFKVAKSDADPGVRGEAIQGLGHAKADTLLSQLYGSEQERNLRERIMQAFFHMGATDQLLEFAKNEKDVKLRGNAIHLLANSRRNPAVPEALVSIYNAEQDKEVKQHILHGLFERNEPSRLIEVARKEADPGLKREAVRMLSQMKSKEATEFLVELLNK